MEMWGNKYQNVNSVLWDYRIIRIYFVCCFSLVLVYTFAHLNFLIENRLITNIKNKNTGQ